jgi:hypothetical protein
MAQMTTALESGASQGWRVWRECGIDAATAGGAEQGATVADVNMGSRPPGIQPAPAAFEHHTRAVAGAA